MAPRPPALIAKGGRGETRHWGDDPPAGRHRGDGEMRLMLSVLIVGGAFLSGAAHAQEVTLESAPPVVVKTAPEAGSGEVDPGTTDPRHVQQGDAGRQLVVGHREPGVLPGGRGQAEVCRG